MGARLLDMSRHAIRGQIESCIVAFSSLPKSPSYAKRSRRWSATRSAFAMTVNAGFDAVLDGIKLASTT